MRITLLGLALSALFVLAPLAHAETLYERECYRAELEVGPFWQTTNDVQVPGDTGTRWAIDDVTGPGPFLAGRVTVDWNPWRRHGFRLVVAPTALEGEGTLDKTVDFAGQTYAPGLDTTARWKFNTYRLSYRFWIPHNRRWHSSVGATVLVRDASIELVQGATKSRKTDLGIVPLLHFDTEYHLNRRWSLVADLDAAWAPQGRAIDFALKARYRINKRWDLNFGYRTIEGGADNDSVYTFSWIHQAVIGVGFRM